MLPENKNELNDEELVKAILKDDHSAFKILFYRYYKSLIQFAWFRIHSMETSRDLVQEVFFKVWTNRKNLNSDKSIKAYLYKSLTNQIISHLNLSSSRLINLDDIETRIEDDNSKGIEFKIDFNSALEHLPEKLKTVFILSRIEGYKYSEIAEICEISVKAVEKRMSQVFTILKKTFSKRY